MKISSGIKKNSLIIFPKFFYKLKSFNPTISIVKKKLFNWLGNIKNKVCLDVFSCSGSLGFEAASRKCKVSILIEKNKKYFFQLKKNKFRLNFNNVKIYNCDYIYYFNKINKYIFDIIFIDCKYLNIKNLKNSLKLILKFTKFNSLIYLETVLDIKILNYTILKNFKILKNDSFNKINFFLFKIS